jgi:hypothetical protein
MVPPPSEKLFTHNTPQRPEKSHKRGNFFKNFSAQALRGKKTGVF